MFPVMYWPLVGGFIAFVLITVLIGWGLDVSRRRTKTGTGSDGH